MSSIILSVVMCWSVFSCEVYESEVAFNVPDSDIAEYVGICDRMQYGWTRIAGYQESECYIIKGE